MNNKSWTQKTPTQSKLEAERWTNLIYPTLIQKGWSAKLFKPDTIQQVKYKIDGYISKLDNNLKQHNYIIECKAVIQDYNAIFAEYKGENSSGYSYDGWMVKPIDPKLDNYDILLIYAFVSNIRVYDMRKLKAWYNSLQDKPWKPFIYYDKVFDQRMYGHLIPLETIKQFEVQL